MAVKVKMKYDTVSRIWKKITENEKSSDNKDKKSGNSSKENKGNVDPNKTAKKSASGKTASKVRRRTIRTLTGSLSFIPNENTIRISPRDTIELHGLGKYLSGKYYVKSVERTFSSSGYSQSAEVIKTNFRKTLKITAKHPESKTNLKDFDGIYKKNLTKYKASHKGASTKKHVVSKGETLYTISKKYFKTTKYARKLAQINGDLPKNRWKSLSAGYKLIIAKK